MLDKPDKLDKIDKIDKIRQTRIVLGTAKLRHDKKSNKIINKLLKYSKLQKNRHTIRKINKTASRN